MVAQSPFRGCISAILPSEAASNNLGTMNHPIRTLANGMESMTWLNWPDWQLAQNLYSQLQIKDDPLEMGFRGCFFTAHTKSAAFPINRSPTLGYWEITTLLSISLMSIKSPFLRIMNDWSLGRVGDSSVRGSWNFSNILLHFEH